VHLLDDITVPETQNDLLRFIVSYGDNVFPNLCTILQILLTVSVSYHIISYHIISFIVTFRQFITDLNIEI